MGRGAALAALVLSALAIGCEVSSEFGVRDAWIAEPPPGAAAAAGYLTLDNPGRAPRVLVGATSPACERVELHRTRVVEGVARMEPLEQLEVPPGGSVRLEPGGAHLMLMRPKPLEAGAIVPLELRLADGTRVQLELPVRRRGDHAHDHH